MSNIQLDINLKTQIAGRLIAEKAKDLSDSELDRCLESCVAPWLIHRAKMFRDCGFLSIRDIEIKHGTYPQLGDSKT